MSDLSKITFRRLEYNINKDKRTIVCRLPMHYMYRDKTFYGVAKAAPEDTWDEEKGKKIARARAESNAYLWARKAAESLLHATIRDEAELTAFIDKALWVKQHNKEYIKSL